MQEQCQVIDGNIKKDFQERVGKNMTEWPKNSGKLELQNKQEQMRKDLRNYKTKKIKKMLKNLKLKLMMVKVMLKLMIKKKKPKMKEKKRRKKMILKRQQQVDFHLNLTPIFRRKRRQSQKHKNQNQLKRKQKNQNQLKRKNKSSNNYQQLMLEVKKL